MFLIAVCCVDARPRHPIPSSIGRTFERRPGYDDQLLFSARDSSMRTGFPCLECITLIQTAFVQSRSAASIHSVRRQFGSWHTIGDAMCLLVSLAARADPADQSETVFESSIFVRRSPELYFRCGDLLCRDLQASSRTHVGH